MLFKHSVVLFVAAMVGTSAALPMPLEGRFTADLVDRQAAKQQVNPTALPLGPNQGLPIAVNTADASGAAPPVNVTPTTKKAKPTAAATKAKGGAKAKGTGAAAKTPGGAPKNPKTGTAAADNGPATAAADNAAAATGSGSGSGGNTTA